MHLPTKTDMQHMQPVPWDPLGGCVPLDFLDEE